MTAAFTSSISQPSTARAPTFSDISVSDQLAALNRMMVMVMDQNRQLIESNKARDLQITQLVEANQQREAHIT